MPGHTGQPVPTLSAVERIAGSSPGDRLVAWSVHLVQDHVAGCVHLPGLHNLLALVSGWPYRCASTVRDTGIRRGPAKPSRCSGIGVRPVKLSLAGALISLALLGSSSQHGASAPAATNSVYTQLGGDVCEREIDRSDPNEIPYMVCPGAAGYALIVRRVGSGRKSVDVVDAAGRRHPLNYELLTRHMFSLGQSAEWRVTTKDGQNVPVALIVRIDERQSIDQPSKVTRSYFAVAKVTPTTACVIDRIAKGSTTQAGLREIADAGQARGCAVDAAR